MISYKYKIFGLVIIVTLGIIAYLIFKPSKENITCNDKHHFYRKKGINSIYFSEAYKNMSQQEQKTRNLCPNFTQKGYIAKKLSPHLKTRLKNLWEKKKHLKKPEKVPHEVIWGTENSSNELLYNLDIATHDPSLKKDLENYIKNQLSQWTGKQNLIHTATFGIREYKRGATLKVHCDRYDTHVLSAILHVKHKQEKPWPLAVWDHQGNKENILLDNNIDLVLYESVGIMHGRPYPFEGDSYVNIFIHFSVPGWKEKMDEILQK
jgi:prolyl 4-hydroxylase